jgi:hypothetical protein
MKGRRSLHPTIRSLCHVEPRKGTRMSRRTLTTAVAVTAVVGLIATSALAAPTIDYNDIPLTQAELDANWVVDRAVPSGGFESVSFESRDSVLEMRVDPDNRSTGSSFFFTEGLLRQTPGAAALKADLYVDPAWEGQDIRAGLWGVGHDESGDRTAFPIIEYHQDTGLGFTGWRVWDSAIGDWVSHPGSTSFGEWATLEIVLDADNNQFIWSVDGVSETLSGLDSTTLGEVIVNMFNYGPGTPAYEVHVSNFAIGEVMPTPATKDDCRNGGYAEFGFTNQGLCIASLVSNR